MWLEQNVGRGGKENNWQYTLAMEQGWGRIWSNLEALCIAIKVD
jgi:hypothetical protein